VSRFIAAIIPFLITVQFFLIGIGVIKDPASVEAMSRKGNPKEILRGPLFYGIVFVVLTIVFWTDSPIGIIALMVLSGGDGFADIVGRRIPSARLFWSPNKSFAGSLAMFLCGTIFALIIIFIFSQLGLLGINFQEIYPKIIILNFVATIIESLPLQDWDNITVPLTVVLLGLILI
jgi:phytol kinase